MLSVAYWLPTVRFRSLQRTDGPNFCHGRERVVVKLTSVGSRSPSARHGDSRGGCAYGRRRNEVIGWRSMKVQNPRFVGSRRLQALSNEHSPGRARYGAAVQNLALSTQKPTLSSGEGKDLLTPLPLGIAMGIALVASKKEMAPHAPPKATVLL